MTEQEERALAQRIAVDSEVFDFEKALELVERMPHKAERLVREREEERVRQERLDRAYRRLHRSAQAMQ
jgi:hypothetical protein